MTEAIKNDSYPRKEYLSDKNTRAEPMEEGEINEIQESCSALQANEQLDDSNPCKENGFGKRKFHQEVEIRENDTHWSYERLFGRLLGDQVQRVRLEDPYIRAPHQIYNFRIFCELLVFRCQNLRHILLITGKDIGEDECSKQLVELQKIISDLARMGVKLSVEFDRHLHDRKVQFDHGWWVKMGRGLDFFQFTPLHKIGQTKPEMRRCQKTTFDFFYDRERDFGKADVSPLKDMAR